MSSNRLSTPKKAYLTIDDAPSRDFLPKMEYLYQHGIPAIFFCIGQSIQEREEATRAAIEHGFLIGNHSFSHPHFSDLSIEQGKQEILQTDSLIERVYGDMGLEWPARYFRFPYFDSGANGAGYGAQSAEPLAGRGGEKHEQFQEYLRSLGYRQPKFEGLNPLYFTDPTLLTRVDVRCTFDQGEYWLHESSNPWGLSNEQDVLARIEKDEPYAGCALNRTDTVDIMLVHDHEKTTDFFYRIIERYIEKGIQFLPIP